MTEIGYFGRKDAMRSDLAQGEQGYGNYVALNHRSNFGKVVN
jgi:hypothetical protein